MLRYVLAAGLILSVPASLGAQDTSFGEWIELFNGEDLTGWQNAKPDPDAPPGTNRWTVEDGALTNSASGSEGNDVCTTNEFEDYELELEYKIPEGGNSGVYLRGQIEVQIYDSHGKEEWDSRDAGAIYGGSFPPLENAAKPAGEWNRYRVLHVGNRITVWHNGVLVQDNIHQPNRTGGAMSRYPDSPVPLTTRRGPLMFQGNHSKVWYRNIRIRPLFRHRNWRPLWNGYDLSEFTARGDNRAKDGLLWEVKDQAFTNAATGHEGHDLWTEQAFGNFLVYYAYRSDQREEDDEGREIHDRSGNSGFYLRDQWEIQILSRQDTSNSHTDGSLYSLRAPDADARHAPGQWNHMFVKLEGQKITVWQNGKRVHHEVVLPTRTDNHGVKTPDFSRAPFKLQGDHGKVWFTNLWIRPLPDDAGS